MTAHTNTVMPAIDSTMPSGSKRCTVASREVGTIRPTRTIATTMTGTFTRNTEPHQK